MPEAPSTSRRSEFSALYQDAPFIRGAVGWLRANGAHPESLVESAVRELRKRGRNLPFRQRVGYAERVLLGQFLRRWAEKHKHRSFDELAADPEWRERELKPFEFAVMAAADERAFKRIIPRLARQKVIDRTGGSLGTGDEFESYVASASQHLARKFLTNFDSARQGAAFRAVRYIQVTAVSSYLVRRTKPIGKNAPKLSQYMAKSTRLDHRTRLAVKLAYLPATLSYEEKAELRTTYGLSGAMPRRMAIKDIAKLLGYPSAATLSRKLYRVCGWCRNSQLKSPRRGGREREPKSRT